MPAEGLPALTLWQIATDARRQGRALDQTRDMPASPSSSADSRGSVSGGGAGATTASPRAAGAASGLAGEVFGRLGAGESVISR